MGLPKIDNFTNDVEALNRLELVEEILPQLVADDNTPWNTLKVVHDEPEVWRLWLQLGDCRLFLHIIHSCQDPFVHFHPWPSIVKILSGGYTNIVANCNGKPELIKESEPEDLDTISSQLVQQEIYLTKGSFYTMTDIRMLHGVKVKPSTRSHSWMLIGREYFKGASKQFSRKQPIKQSLTQSEVQLQLREFREILNIS